jgi:serine/threonine protein kinase
MASPSGVVATSAIDGCITEAYSLDGIVGQGSFGVVHAAHRLADSEAVVVKQVHIDSLSESERRSALQEASVLSEFNHANIIQYYDARCHAGALASSCLGLHFKRCVCETCRM